MTDFKVTDGMHTRALIQYDAIAEPGVNTRALREALEAALAHPDFRAQVAELMRGMVPEAEHNQKWDSSELRAIRTGRNFCREETLASIQQWEQGA